MRLARASEGSVRLSVGVKSDTLFPTTHATWITLQLDAIERGGRDGSEPALRELRDLGAEVLLHRRGVLHAKLLVVDGETAVVGSANFDMRSFFLNYEVGVVVRGESALSRLRALMGELAAESRPPSEASVRRAHRWHGRLLERAAGWIAPLL